jgi:hypothetical protein
MTENDENSWRRLYIWAVQTHAPSFLRTLTTTPEGIPVMRQIISEGAHKGDLERLVMDYLTLINDERNIPALFESFSPEYRFWTSDLVYSALVGLRQPRHFLIFLRNELEKSLLDATTVCHEMFDEAIEIALSRGKLAALIQIAPCHIRSFEQLSNTIISVDARSAYHTPEDITTTIYRLMCLISRISYRNMWTPSCVSCSVVTYAT